MIQRQTQTAQYWDEAFSIEDADLEHLYTLLLEDETPLTTDELVLSLVRRRIEREEHAIQRQMYGAGSLYLPKESYTVGQELIFPQIDFANGKVASVRAGNNPEFNSFDVITVDFGPDRPHRSFAARLENHKLNAANGSLADGESHARTPAEIAADQGRVIAPKLESRLRAKGDIVRIASRWFPKGLLADIHEGHLNLAEAVLDMASGGPLPTLELMKHLELPATVNEKLKVFSLDYALQEDARFDEVGPAGQVQWHLRRLEPAEVKEAPRCLRYEAGAPSSAVRLHPELIKLEHDLDDEFSPLNSVTASPAKEVTLSLTFPHLRAGTLPLSEKLSPLFPTAYESPRIRFILVDGHTGEKRPGWVVRQGRYVFGLADWYKKYDMPVGGHLTVQQGETPGEVIVKIARRRPVREWVRTATLNGRLSFSMQKRPISVEYDEQMIVAVDNPAAIDDIWQKMTNAPLEKVVLDIFRELAKLTPQSAVHARSLYSAVNVVRRAPPGDIFGELALRPYYAHVGDAYWRFDESHYSE